MSRRSSWSIAGIAFLSAWVVEVWTPGTACAQEEGVVLKGAEVAGGPVTGVPVEVDLRDLPIVPPWQPGDPIRDVPRRHFDVGRPVLQPARGLDPLVERQWSSAAAVPAFTQVFNFEATSDNGFNPNDPTGDVGFAFFVQGINASTITIYNKSDAKVAAGPFALGSLAPSGACSAGAGDPIVVYDHLAGRWLLSELSSSGTLCLYVSLTGNPVNGGWCFYEFLDPVFPDYPKYAVWPDAYLATSNQGSSVPVYAFDRQMMVGCGMATYQKLSAPGLPHFGFQAFTPADLDGPAPPPGAPGYFLRHRDEELHEDPGADPATDKLEIWALDVDFGTPGHTTLTQLPDVIVADFDSKLCNLSSSCVPQPAGDGLDSLLEVIMNRLSYRNFGTHETLVGVFQVDVGDPDDHSGERWFELRKIGTGDWTLFQEGTFSPDAEGRFMGTTAMDGSGNILLAYNVSSTSVYPSLRYTGRLATDPSGEMTIPEVTLAHGRADNGSSRYGDYNQMGVDPVDDCTFWFLGMYNPGEKGVRVGAVRFDDTCPGGTASNTAPQVTILTPEDGASLSAGASTLFAASALDAEDGDLTSDLVWSSTLGGGSFGTTGCVTSGLGAGTQTITAAVTDSGGLQGSAQVTVDVTALADVPGPGVEVGPCPDWQLTTTVKIPVVSPINRTAFIHDVDCLGGPGGGPLTGYDQQSSGTLISSCGCKEDPAGGLCTLESTQWVAEYGLPDNATSVNEACVLTADGNPSNDCTCAAVTFPGGEIASCPASDFLVFGDGFESGDTTAWSSTAP